MSIATVVSPVIILILSLRRHPEIMHNDNRAGSDILAKSNTEVIRRSANALIHGQKGSHPVYDRWVENFDAGRKRIISILKDAYGNGDALAAKTAIE